MASDDDQRSAFTRPGFIAAAALVAVLVIAGIVIAVVVPGSGSSHQPQAAPTAPVSRPTSPAGTATTPAGPTPSICGLPGTVLSGTLTTVPKTTWKYQGVIAYPSSPVYGPGKTAAAGYRYCFQHSPAGAVFATGNAITNALASESGPNGTGQGSWISYFVAQGPYRHQTIASQGGSGSSAPPAGEQVAIKGFQLLGYTGKTATVVLAVDISGGGHSGLGAFTYALIWQDGDWHLDATTTNSFSAGPLSSLQNYVQWKAAS